MTVESIDLEFARATTVQKIRREAETRHLFYHTIRHLLRYYLDEREKFLKALGSVRRTSANSGSRTIYDRLTEHSYSSHGRPEGSI